MVVFPMAMTIPVAAVMVVANADTNRANMDADNCCVGSRGQQAKCKDRRNKRFHRGQLSVRRAASGPQLDNFNDRRKFPRKSEIGQEEQSYAR